MQRVLLLLIPFLLLLNGCASEKPSNKAISNEDKVSSIELLQSKEEQKEWDINKWENDLGEIANAGIFGGDRGALYFLGLTNMIGSHGKTIDVEAANAYFALSASLGFAPSIDKIRSMYLHDKPNFYLMMVYLNLTIVAGHLEFAKSYHKFRDEIVRCLGVNIAREIERIALRKQRSIEENIRELKQNKITDFIANNAFTNITAEDSLFDGDFWFKVHKGDVG
jgi:hypothetical protein